jgi:hypothetical protein
METEIELSGKIAAEIGGSLLEFEVSLESCIFYLSATQFVVDHQMFSMLT